MPTTHPMGARKDRSGWLLGSGVALLVLAALLLAASLAMHASPAWQVTGKRLLATVPYALLAGFALLVLYAVLRPKPDSRSRAADEPTLFGRDTTEFAPDMDDGGGGRSRSSSDRR